MMYSQPFYTVENRVCLYNILWGMDKYKWEIITPELIPDIINTINQIINSDQLDTEIFPRYRISLNVENHTILVSVQCQKTLYQEWEEIKRKG